MNGGKLVLLAIALVAVGTVVMPQTVSLFAGQHWWYNISGTGNQIPCQKCHADVFEELNYSNFHKNWGTKGVADQEDCAACHRSNLSIQYALVNGSVTSYHPGKQAHAASVVACMMCHQLPAYANNATSEPGYYAGGFNISAFKKYGINSPYHYSNATYNGLYAAHNAFIAMAIKNKTFPDSTEACVACHTHVAVKIVWHHKTSLEFNVTIKNPVTLNNSVHNWNVSNWSVSGTATTTVWGTANANGNGSTAGKNYSSTWPWSSSNKLSNIYYSYSYP